MTKSNSVMMVLDMGYGSFNGTWNGGYDSTSFVLKNQIYYCDTSILLLKRRHLSNLSSQL